jgi:hypothetical protein
VATRMHEPPSDVRHRPSRHPVRVLSMTDTRQR